MIYDAAKHPKHYLLSDGEYQIMKVKTLSDREEW